MKKLALVLIVLLALSGVAFAEDANLPTVGAWLHTSATVDQSGVDFGPAWGQGNGDTASYLLFWLNWSGDDVGFSGNVVAGMDTLPLGMRNWHVYYEFMDDMFKVTVGKIRSGEYRYTDFIRHSNYGGGGLMSRVSGGATNSVMLQVFPVDGLSIAANVQVDPAYTLEQTALATSYYAKYTAADLVEVVGGFDINGDLASAYAFGGFKVLAVDGLDAEAVYVYNAGASSVNASAGYGVDAFYGAVAGSVGFGTALTYSVSGDFSYAMDGITPALYASYGSTGSYTVEADARFAISGQAVELGFGFSDGAWYVPVFVTMSF